MGPELDKTHILLLLLIPEARPGARMKARYGDVQPFSRRRSVKHLRGMVDILHVVQRLEDKVGRALGMNVFWTIHAVISPFHLKFVLYH